MYLGLETLSGVTFIASTPFSSFQVLKVFDYLFILVALAVALYVEGSFTLRFEVLNAPN